jgi:putative FmdB family regulatory protein
MPTYEYLCRDCGHGFDIVQAFKDETLTICPACGGVLRKVFAAPAISFKGSGFYATDSRKRGSESRHDGSKHDGSKDERSKDERSKQESSKSESSTQEGSKQDSKESSSKSDTSSSSSSSSSDGSSSKPKETSKETKRT